MERFTGGNEFLRKLRRVGCELSPRSFLPRYLFQSSFKWNANLRHNDDVGTALPSILILVKVVFVGAGPPQNR